MRFNIKEIIKIFSKRKQIIICRVLKNDETFLAHPINIYRPNAFIILVQIIIDIQINMYTI